MTIPAVKNAFAANASRFESPASSKKIVLMPQISDAANVFPKRSTRYRAWIERGVGRASVTTRTNAHRAACNLRRTELRPSAGPTETRSGTNAEAGQWGPYPRPSAWEAARAGERLKTGHDGSRNACNHAG